MNKKILLIMTCLIFFNSVFFAVPVCYISPNNDGIQDKLEIPLKVYDKDGFLRSWSFEITDSENNLVKIEKSPDIIPEKIGFKEFFNILKTPKHNISVPEVFIWDGTMNDGNTVPDGLYYYYVTATDNNGNKGESIKRSVYVDNTVPEVVITIPYDNVFGEGEKKLINIKQTGSREDLWVGTISNSEGKIIKNYKWENTMPEDFVWDGTDDNGVHVTDGIYSYKITSTDRAGNKCSSEAVNNIIYSSDKPLVNIYLNSPRYFSPETESLNSNVDFRLKIQIPDDKSFNKLIEWNVNIRDSAYTVVRTYNYNDYGLIPPDSIIFDGKDEEENILPDGEYIADVSAKYLNGYVTDIIYSPSVVISREKAKVRIDTSDNIFGAGNKKSIDFYIRLDPSDSAPVEEWTGHIRRSDDSSIVKTYILGKYPPDHIIWDGIDDNEEFVESGEYFFEISGTDLAGNIGGGKTSEIITFNPDEINLSLTNSYNTFSPNGDKVLDIMKFTPVMEDCNISAYDFEIRNARNELFYYKRSNKGQLPDYFEWNGKDIDGIVCEDGKYFAVVEVLGKNGSNAIAYTKLFNLDNTAPYLEAEIPWNVFSTDGNGVQKNIPVLITSVTDEELWKAEIRNEEDVLILDYSWNGIKDSFVWDGTNSSGNIVEDGVYSIIFFAEDNAGNKFSTKLENIVLDNRKPEVYITTEYYGISPNNDDILDSQIFKIESNVTDSISFWEFNIISENSGEIIFTFSEDDSVYFPNEIIWNGADYEGYACEGIFFGEINIIYENTNYTSSVSNSFMCTAMPPIVRVRTAPKYFSPDNDGEDDELYIKLSGKARSEIESWSFVIKDSYGNDFWKLSGDSQITEYIIWDGFSNIYEYENGEFECVQPYTDYTYEFTVTDDLGMSSTATGIISVN